MKKLLIFLNKNHHSEDTKKNIFSSTLGNGVIFPLRQGYIDYFFESIDVILTSIDNRRQFVKKIKMIADVNLTLKLVIIVQ